MIIKPGKVCILYILAGLLLLSCGRAAKNKDRDYPIKPVAFTAVSVDDSFWFPRLETNRTVTIPYTFKQCEDTGRVRNFDEAAAVNSGTTESGEFCSRYTFDDSDLFKIIEGASYSLKVKYDPDLDRYLDDLIAKLAAAQEPDGYLYTARTVNAEKPHDWVKENRWDNLYMGHELYNMGHLYEAAYAHFLATEKRSLLDVALKNADLIAAEFGPDNRRGVPGHQVIEIGLAKLYRITGERKYLDLARFFLDERGNADGHQLFGEYSQDHIPVFEQTEAVGHAVRAAYMYAGMADIAALTGDRRYIDAIGDIWEDVVYKKLYLTGGIGAAGAWEGFGPAYELPNANAYAETCASIGNVFWNHRMFLLHGGGKYIDVLERVLYNGALSGTGFSGDLFFYPNPLASFGQHVRSPWFTCACCPSNVTRFMASIPGYAYAVKEKNLYINLFMQGTAEIALPNTSVLVQQKTDYPWDGNIKISITPEKEAEFTLFIRIPGWARNQPLPGDLYRYAAPHAEKPVLKLNDQEHLLEIVSGYAALEHSWRAGDTVELFLPMPVRRVLAHDAVKADNGRVAIERGPLVYCAEWPDNQGHTHNLILPDDTALNTEFRTDFLQGLTVISGKASALRVQNGASVEEEQDITLIPYYAWSHRGKGEMAVWLARSAAAARAMPEPGLAGESKLTGSKSNGIAAVNDRYEPESSSDHAIPRYHWWPKKGTVEWIQFEFEKPIPITGAAVYWFDDTGTGECRVPKSWRVLFWKDGSWIPVENRDLYRIDIDRFNPVEFAAVKTKALKLEIKLQEKFSAGILECKIK